MYNGEMDTAYSSADARGCRLDRSTRIEFDRFVRPTAINPLGAVRSRDRVAIRGVVDDVSCVAWHGTPVVEATITDDTGSVVLAFVGRRYLPGIDVCRHLGAGGTVVAHRGRLIFMNPVVWFIADDDAGTPNRIVGIT